MTATEGSSGARQYPTTRQRFRESFARALRDYLGRPDEANAHDLRVTLRRVQASYRVLPKKLRKRRRIRRYEARCSKVIRLTSRVRDIDVLISKLNGHDGETRESGNRLIRNLQLERATAVEKSMRASWTLFESVIPILDGEDSADESRQTSRFVTKLEGKIRRELPRVTTEEGDTEELHRLRKLCKRLRYALELSAKTNERDGSVKALKRWQDQLGDIRDSDVFLKYLDSRRGWGDQWIGGLIRAERAKRHILFDGFVSDSRKTGPSLLIARPTPISKSRGVGRTRARPQSSPTGK